MSESKFTESQDSKNLDLSFFGGILQELENVRVEEPTASKNSTENIILGLDNIPSDEAKQQDTEADMNSEDSFEDQFSEHETWLKKVLESTTKTTEVSIIEYPDIPIRIRNHEKLLPELEMKEEIGRDPFIESLQKQREQREKEKKQKSEKRAQDREKEDKEWRNWNMTAESLVQEIVDSGIEKARKACKSVKIMKRLPKSN